MKNIPFVRKEDNPPNVPQARPIEKFWTLSNRRVYDYGWGAMNEERVKRRSHQKVS